MKLLQTKPPPKRSKPYFNVNCKRPTFHDEYLPAFNKPNVTLVNTEGQGVESVITPEGVVVDGKLFEVDCIIFATGFEVFSPTYVTGEYTVTGRGGQSLQDKWSEQFSTLHGMLTHGFPNMAWLAICVMEEVAPTRTSRSTTNPLMWPMSSRRR